MTAIHTGLTERIIALAKGISKSTTKKRGYFCFEAMPDLVDDIWNQIGGYQNQNWGLPQDQTLLENILGKKESDTIYNIQNTAVRNAVLHDALSAPLKNYDYDLRLKAMVWIIYDWGHVRGDSEKHESWPTQFQNYQPEVINSFISSHYRDRIASWSKVLAFADSSNYAIYDARVAMSLNAIFEKLGRSERFYMPVASSKKINKCFQDISRKFQAQATAGNPKYLGYFDYMSLLNAFVNKVLAPNVLECEMRLFANGPDFAEAYAKKHKLI